ncbi:MAG: DUF2799 domain-containing protein [Alphaproteobacteria bacterium]
MVGDGLLRTGQLVCVFLITLLVASCSAIRPEHCPYADWGATGELHASKGFQSRLPGLYDTCLPVGVLPDGDAYIAGYQRGLLRFCTIENGWVWGGNRTVNPNICPPALAPGFDRAFNTRAKLEAMNVDEASLEARRDQLEDMIFEGYAHDVSVLRELREIRSDLERLEVERHRTRSGFASWLQMMGLEVPLDLYSY